METKNEEEMLPIHLFFLFFFFSFKKMSQNLSSLSFGIFFLPENTQKKQTKTQISFILNRKVIPNQKISLELFWNIQVLKENYQD